MCRQKSFASYNSKFFKEVPVYGPSGYLEDCILETQYVQGHYDVNSLFPIVAEYGELKQLLYDCINDIITYRKFVHFCRPIMLKCFLFLFTCLTILLAASFFSQAQKGYAKLDAGPAVIFKRANASASLAFGYKPHSRAGIGAKIQGIKNYGTLLLGEFRGFIPLSDIILFSVGVNAGKRVYNNKRGTFVYGFEGSFMFGRSKIKLCLSAAGFFLQEKRPDEIINFGAFYPSLGITFF